MEPKAGLAGFIIRSLTAQGVRDVWKAAKKAGKKLDLSEKLIFTPKGSTASLKWKSSDESVATVSSSGKVTALTPGTVTITVKGSGGLKATVKIKVK